jgi:hypothetical protein
MRGEGLFFHQKPGVFSLSAIKNWMKSGCKKLKVPSGKRLQVAIEAMAIEIVDLPSKNSDFP